MERSRPLRVIMPEVGWTQGGCYPPSCLGECQPRRARETSAGGRRQQGGGKGGGQIDVSELKKHRMNERNWGGEGHPGH